LYNAGYLKTTSDPAYGFNAFLTSMFETFSKSIFHLLPIQSLVRSSLGKKFLYSSGTKGNIDFSKTKALYHSVCSRGIRINLKDKYKEGIVDEKDYVNLRSELIGFLNNLKDPETGENVVETVYTSEEIYGKDAVNDPLDLIFDLKEGYSAQELIQPVGGMKSYLNWNGGLSVISPPGFYDWIGDHSQYGILFMYGNNIKKGKKLDASVVDIVPTVLSALNLSIPSYIDGSVLADAFVEKPKIKIAEEKMLTKKEIDEIKKLRLKMKKSLGGKL
jgi:predicted AlkP superfamily phosphohydrolase/phosphomutase